MMPQVYVVAETWQSAWQQLTDRTSNYFETEAAALEHRLSMEAYFQALGRPHAYKIFLIALPIHDVTEQLEF